VDTAISVAETLTTVQTIAAPTERPNEPIFEHTTQKKRKWVSVYGRDKTTKKQITL